MKKIFFAFLLFVLWAGPLPAGTTVANLTDGSGSVATSQYTICDTGTATDKCTIASVLALGATGYTPPFALGATRGAAVANTGFSDTPNYTKTGGCVESTASGMVCTGAGTFTLKVFAPTAGVMYQVDLVPSALTAETFHVSVGGTASPEVTPTATQNYRFYLVAGSTAGAVATTSAGTSITFSSMTIKPVQNPSLVIDTNSGLAVQNNVYIAAIAGYVFQEYELAAYAVVLKSMNGADSFYLGPTAYTTNITLGAARQAFISFGCYATGTWDFLGQNGAATGN